MSAGIETWGGGSRKIRGKASKLELITAIAKSRNQRVLDLSGLTLSDLHYILTVAKKCRGIECEVPNSRLKQPYIDKLEQILPNIKNWSKLSVTSLKSLLGAFKYVD